MPDESELEKRLRQLEEENARLRSASLRPREFTVREDSYQGHPLLVFERPNGQQFKLGVSKLKAIRAHWHKVEEFLSRHGAESADRSSGSGRSTHDRI